MLANLLQFTLRRPLQESPARNTPGAFLGPTNYVSAMLNRWCANVKRSKVEAMKKVAQMILDHFEGVTAWAQTRQTNGFLEAINGLFQAAKRKARGYGRFQTMRTVVYLVAGNLNFSTVNPHAKA
jgi:transposase